MIELDYLVQVVSIPFDLIEASGNTNSDLYGTYKSIRLLNNQIFYGESGISMNSNRVNRALNQAISHSGNNVD